MSHSKDIKKTVEIRLALARKEKEILELELQLASQLRKGKEKPSPKKKQPNVTKKKKRPSDENLDEAGPIERPPRAKRRRVKSSLFTMPNPTTGNKMKVGSFSPTADRMNYDRMKKAIAEGDAGGEATDVVIKILKEGLKRGHRWLDTSLVPARFLVRARDELREELPPEEFERYVNTDIEESSLSESFESFWREYAVHPVAWDDPQEEGARSYREDLLACRMPTVRVLDQVMEDFRTMKVYVAYKCVMGKKILRALAEGAPTEIVEEQVMTITSVAEDRSLRPAIIRRAEESPDEVDIMLERVQNFLEVRMENGSGLVWLKSLAFTVYVSRIVGCQTGPFKRLDTKAPITVGTWVKLPKWLRSRRIQNPKPHRPSTSQECFAHAINRGRYPLKPEAHNRGTNIVDIEDKVGEIFLPEGVTYPIPLDSAVLMRIQELNDFSFSIFELGNSPGQVITRYISPFRGQRPEHFLLGLLNTTEGNHFVLIGEKTECPLGKLFGQNKDNHRRFFCEGCLAPFAKETALSAHEVDCLRTQKAAVGLEKDRQKAEEALKIRMPMSDKQRYLKFTKWQHRLKAPFAVYADLEALLETHGTGEDAFEVHKPCCWAYKIVCEYQFHYKERGVDGKPLGEMRYYCGKNAMHEFLRSLGKDLDTVEGLIHGDPEPMEDLDFDTRLGYESATHCHICQKPMGGTKTRDHDHFTGEYRGPAHNYCNLQYSYVKHGGEDSVIYRLPVFFHNLKGYDGYHVLRGLKGFKDLYSADISVIARSLDRYTSFSIDHLRFIDTMGFLVTSLDKMVETRAGGTFEERKKNWPLVYNEFIKRNPFVHPWDEEEALELFLKKGVYPYEHMQTKENLAEDGLPPIDAFFSKLRGEGITEEDYERAKQAWAYLGCKTMEDYTVEYCKLDVLLLADSFEALRDKCLDTTVGCGLDPAHYVTAPSLSWDAMLLFNHKKDVVIENMTDKEMLLMVKDHIRGGMCQVMNPPDRNPDGVRYMYWDVNNLYGTVMRLPLPLCDYRWLYNPSREWDEDYVNDVHDEVDLTDWSSVEQALDRLSQWDRYATRGCILEVDLDVPEDLHDHLNDYPLCPNQKLCDNVSGFTKTQFADEGVPWKPPKVGKLVSDLTSKTHYVIHYWNLKQALSLGYILKKVHRVFDFVQRDWLADYINFLTDRRKEASDSGDMTGKELYKLLANSIYGKTVEDVMRRREVRIFFGDKWRKGFKKAEQYASECRFRQGKVIWSSMDEDEPGMMVMEILRRKVVIDRPIVVGFTVLELSKWWMFDFHYNAVKPAWGKRARLMYTDTDSLVYRFKTDDFATELETFKKQYPDRLHNSALGALKDEHGGYAVAGFIALRPKMYAFGYGEDYKGMKHMKHKGFPKKSVDTVTKKKTTYQTYWDVYAGKTGHEVTFRKIRPEIAGTSNRVNKLNSEVEKGRWLLKTVPVTKRGIKFTDDKSHWFTGESCTRYGHWRVAAEEPFPTWDEEREAQEFSVWAKKKRPRADVDEGESL